MRTSVDRDHGQARGGGGGGVGRPICDMTTSGFRGGVIKGRTPPKIQLSPKIRLLMGFFVSC